MKKHPTLRASWKKHSLIFKRASGTSRGILRKKESWFILLENDDRLGTVGIGECGLLKGLSCDDLPDYEQKLQTVCDRIHEHEFWLSEGLLDYPSIRFGLEMALRDFETGGKRQLFPSAFTQGEEAIHINGLVWMGDRTFMFQQIKEKLAAGFRCIKLKIGAINFSDELDLLKYIRHQFSESDVEIRVDANGAFRPDEALDKLQRLAELQLHSIEQPIKQGQFQEMARLCEQSPLDIALDEELIGVARKGERENLLDSIRPPYIILKPSLVGGFASSEEWINLAKERGIDWWVTSALESNIGLNGIAQWTQRLGNAMPQGLGTGQLYSNNFPSPLYISHGHLWHGKYEGWNLDLLNNPQ